MSCYFSHLSAVTDRGEFVEFLIPGFPPILAVGTVDICKTLIPGFPPILGVGTVDICETLIPGFLTMFVRALQKITETYCHFLKILQKSARLVFTDKGGKANQRIFFAFRTIPLPFPTSTTSISDQHHFRLVLLVEDRFTVKLCNTHCLFTLKATLIGYHP